MVSINWEKNYYKVLGISSKASIDEINKRYRFLVRLNHPDINKNADEKFLRELNEAHDVLGNRISKALYDRNCILDLEYEDRSRGYITEADLEENPFSGNNPFTDNEETDEKRSFFKNRFANFFSPDNNRFFDEELNNPYITGSSYNPEYQRAIDGKNTIIDFFDKEIHYLNAFKNDLKENKHNIISYNNEDVRNRLSLPFFNKGISLLSVYNLDLSNDKKYITKFKKVKKCLYETIYIFARLLENKSYSFLCCSNLVSKNDFFIEKANELYEVLFDLLGMTTGEALFSDVIYKSIKNQPKEEQIYMKMKYEICLCYVSFRKLCDKKEKLKTLTKSK